MTKKTNLGGLSAVTPPSQMETASLRGSRQPKKQPGGLQKFSGGRQEDCVQFAPMGRLEPPVLPAGQASPLTPCRRLGTGMALRPVRTALVLALTLR